ncbi:hypothetical protein [Sphingomonas sp. 2378]|uniref:hypothetical protein n=1 Tax=Sphingomonas sp. 2378 TaxID=1219748 RepID=UPI00277EAD2C|nr:hypothetical protein [Sphingomonas sp. SORGH_AS_0879]
MLLSFGFSTFADLLSWIVVLTLGTKVGATTALLVAGKDIRDQPGWGSGLWWLTKLTPYLAIACAIALAMMREHDAILPLSAMAVFVAIAVPLKIRQRRVRIRRRRPT